MNKDDRWRSNPRYLFWATNIFQKYQLKNLTSVVRHNKQRNVKTGGHLKRYMIQHPHSCLLKSAKIKKNNPTEDFMI